MNDINALARNNIRQLVAYQSAGRIGRSGNIWLNANEAPSSPDFTLPQAQWNRYAEDQPAQLLTAYANYVGVNLDQLLVCRGADEGIDLLIRTFCEPRQESIIYCPPTYGMYAIYAETSAVAANAIAIDEHGQLDLPAIAANLPSCKVVYLCNPNNPTGHLFSAASLQQLLEITRNKTIVAIDEAYIEFCPEYSAVKWLDDYPHLVILRTLSKAFSLAGLHCGFVLANPPVIELLKKVLAPYPIPTPVALLAAQALSTENIALMHQTVQTIIAQRQQLFQALSSLPYVEKVFASQTNFLLAKWQDANAVEQFLISEGINIRAQPSGIGLDNCLRITIGTPAECQQLLASLTNFSPIQNNG